MEHDLWIKNTSVHEHKKYLLAFQENKLMNEQKNKVMNE